MRSRGLAWFLALAVLALVAAVATADSAPSKSTDGSAQDAPASAQADVAAAADPTADPPSGNDEWPLVDQTSGRRYRLETLPKVEGAYQRLEDGKTILLPLGAKFEVVREDDKTFWVKYFEPQTQAARDRLEVKKGPTPEELAAIKASYDAEVAVGHSLAFDEFDRGLPRQGQWRNGFDVADMNEDGHPDIVFGPPRKGITRPSIFLGDGAGGWRTWTEAVFPNLGYDYGDAEAADWNGDGHLDVAFAVHLRGLLLLVGDGKGKFEPWSEGIGFELPGAAGGDLGAFSSRAIDAVDWNGDGKLDLIALGEGPKGRGPGTPKSPNQMVDTSRGFLVYLNRGDGTWQPWRPLQGSDNVRPNFGDDFVMVDLDHDADLDLVTSSRQLGSQEILNIDVGHGIANEMALPLVRPRAIVSAVATAELDGNDYPDLVIGYTNREEGVWRTGLDVLYGGDGLSWTRRPLFSEESRRDIAAVATGDLDGDGHPDVVATTGEGEVLVYLGDGHGFFVREDVQLMPSEPGCAGNALRLEDLDGDGRDEIIAGFAGEPEGFLNMPGLTVPGCTGHGSLRVWKVSPLPAS